MEKLGRPANMRNDERPLIRTQAGFTGPMTEVEANLSHKLCRVCTRDDYPNAKQNAECQMPPQRSDVCRKLRAKRNSYFTTEVETCPAVKDQVPFSVHES